MSPALVAQADLLKERLRQAPTTPGVYVMRDEKTRVIYVGKALNLRNRLRSYFQPGQALPIRTARLVAQVCDFDLLTCSSEQEALLLENTMIKRYRPRYNVRLRDDKSYLYMKVPRLGDFPRVYTARKIADDGARYFGPFSNAGALRSTMRTLRRIFPYRTCSDEVLRRGHVCLDFHIKRCAGPCEGLVSAEEYRANLDQIGVFMEGRTAELTRTLRADMLRASAAQEYEHAARLRDRIDALEKVAERQRVLSQAAREQDVVGLARGGAEALVSVLTVRAGKVISSESFELEGTVDSEPAEILNGFLGQFYANATSYPREVLLAMPIEDSEVLGNWLSERRGARVAIEVPQRGARLHLVRMATQNADEALRQTAIKKDYDTERTDAILADLQEALGLDRAPRRIECYDISNLMGTNPVGSMVVFEDGRPRPSHYRRFHIRKVVGSNDFAMMQEMLRRRFARLVAARAVATEAEAEGADEKDSSSFAALPDLVIIDGGKGQLSAVREVMQALDLHQIPTFGLAKRKEELYEPGRSRSIMLPLDAPALFLLQRLRDEAHRFAVTFHRQTRAKATLSSPLSNVPGLGPVRRRALMKRFRSVEGIRAATLEELTEVVPAAVAAALREQL